MVKVIETNLSMNGDIVMDHQSRIIEVDSWDSYVDEFKHIKPVSRNSILGSLHGYSLPSQSKVENLIYDECHLSCDIYNRIDVKTKKLAYLI